VDPAVLSRHSYREAALDALNRLPPFSPVLQRLLASLSDENISFAHLGATVEGDTVLSGNVLRLVNSSLYGRRGTVSSIRHAISILGVNKFRNYLLGLSVNRLWFKLPTPPCFHMGQFNLHGSATAAMADILVQYIACPFPEGAFVGGLLHDVGRLLIAVALPAEYAAVLERFQANREPLGDCERATLDTTHSALAAEALARWNLPEPIVNAVGDHQAPPEAASLAAILRAASTLADALGYAVSDAEESRAPAAVEIFESLGLAAMQEGILAAFQTDIESFKTSG
jgi:HD-like signal output (HDOD) protein